jgi:hypothetical protein
MGDLNYRVAMPRKDVDAALLAGDIDVLRNVDQLTAERRDGRVFRGAWREGPLSFPPTYKFDTHCDVYDSSAKQRVPSWTDRVLFRANPPLPASSLVSASPPSSAASALFAPVSASCGADAAAAAVTDVDDRMRLLAYDSVATIRTSDHRPVYAVLSVAYAADTAKPRTSDNSRACIVQ